MSKRKELSATSYKMDDALVVTLYNEYQMPLLNLKLSTQVHSWHE